MDTDNYRKEVTTMTEREKAMRAAMIRIGSSPVKLAEKLGVPRQTIYQLMRGSGTSSPLLTRIVEELGVAPEIFLPDYVHQMDKRKEV